MKNRRRSGEYHVQFSIIHGMKRITCEYNADTACVELRLDGDLILAVDCIAVENEIPRNRFERSALDWLVYNAPLEYMELVLSGEIEDYLQKYTDYSRLD